VDNISAGGHLVFAGGGDEATAFVPASYAAREDPGEVRNFRVSGFVGVESTILILLTGSPLR
jgi:hypothetical protein